MKPFICMALPTGHVYQFPAQIIAENRAKCMQELHPDEFPDLAAAMEDTVGLFEDDYEVRDWALNNMNPDEYMPQAVLVRFTPPERDYNAAEWTHHDAPAIVGEIEGQAVMEYPLEVLVTAMGLSRQLCNISVLNGADGKPFAAVAVMVGNEIVLQPYLTSLSRLTDQIAEAIKAAQQPAAETNEG